MTLNIKMLPSLKTMQEIIIQMMIYKMFVTLYILIKYTKIKRKNRY